MNAPEWAGCYRIVAVATSPPGVTPPTAPPFSNVALIIDANPNGRSGFVRWVDSNVRPPLYNLNFDEPLGGFWRYQNED